MSRLLYFTFYLLFSLNTKAQTLTSYSKIYYVDGSILIGEISSWSKDTVEIILANAAKIPIPRNLIKRIVHKETNPRVMQFSRKGYYCKLNFGINFNQNVIDNFIGTVLHFSTGYVLTQNWSVGITSGLEKYNLIAPHQIIPLGIEIQYSPTVKLPHLYVNLRSGYGFAYIPNNQSSDWSGHGGLMIHPALGLRYKISKYTDLHVDFGMQTQQAFFTQRNLWIGAEKDEYRLNYKRLIFRLGINI